MSSIPTGINKATQAEIIANLSQKLKANYLYPEIAGQIAQRLQEHLENEEYAAITDGAQLAEILTGHIQEVNQDRHLKVRWYAEPLPDQEGTMAQNQVWMDEWHQQAGLDNYGLHRAERLLGNVGYLDIREFYFPSWGGDTAVAAMNFIAHTNALIIDLRKCRGGDPDMVALISSYLFGEQRVHLNSIYSREQDVTEQYWTLPYVPGKHYGDKPIYVLTSKDTFSGAEEFSYNLKTRKRATLIGETTGGGAHIGTPYRIHAHFDVFIPVGKPVNPLTGTNWEGSGVSPDVPTAQEQALQVAYGMALKTILANLGESHSTPLKALLEEAKKALNELEST
jgi:hypothetical protein